MSNTKGDNLKVFWFGLSVLGFSLLIYWGLGFNQIPKTGEATLVNQINPAPEESLRCVVCGKIFPKNLMDSSLVLEENGEKKVYFDSSECRRQFEKNPYKYVNVKVEIKLQPGIPPQAIPQIPFLQKENREEEAQPESSSPEGPTQESPDPVQKENIEPESTPSPAKKPEIVPAPQKTSAPVVIPKEDQDLLEELPLH